MHVYLDLVSGTSGLTLTCLPWLCLECLATKAQLSLKVVEVLGRYGLKKWGGRNGNQAHRLPPRLWGTGSEQPLHTKPEDTGVPCVAGKAGGAA